MSQFMTISMKESEKARFRTWLNGLSQENQTECQRIVVDTIEGIRHKALRLAPVDKGALKLDIVSVINSNKMGGTVYANAKYSAFKEWGTGEFVNVPSFVKTMFGVDSMDWKGKTGRKVNSKPHPYFFEPARVGVNEMVVKLKNMGFKEK